MLPDYDDRDPSSGRVDTIFAASVLAQLGEGNMAETDRQTVIQELVCAFVQKRRYPFIALAAYIAANLDDVKMLRNCLRHYITMKEAVREKLARTAASFLATVVRPQDGVLVYGYSEPVLSGLERLAKEQKASITIFVSEVSARRFRAEATKVAYRLRDQGFRVTIIPDSNITHHLIWDKPQRQDKRALPRINKILTGCKSIILRKEGQVKFSCTSGARQITEVASVLTQNKGLSDVDAKVYVVGELYKIWSTENDEKYIQDILLESGEDWFELDENEPRSKNESRILAENFMSDVVPARVVDCLITEHEALRLHDGEPKPVQAVLVDACVAEWRELNDCGFWNPATRARGLDIVTDWIYRQLATHPHVATVGPDIEESRQYVTELISRILEKPAADGSDDLSQLIALAVDLRHRASETGQPGLRVLAEEAWTGASAAFRKYREDLFLAKRKDVELPDREVARLAAKYAFCEYKVRQYDSLGALDLASERHVTATETALNAFASSIVE